MSLYLLILIAVAILVGAWLFMRSPPPPPLGTVPPPEGDEARALRELVVRKLRERMVGWSFETPADEPLLVVAGESASEKHVRLDLAELGSRWKALRDQGEQEKAEVLVERWVEGAAEGAAGVHEETTETSVDEAAFTTALALQLERPDDVPAGTLARRVGPFAAVLVLRNPERPEPVTTADLEEHKLDAERAFALALENLEADSAEGLPAETLLGPDDEPEAVQLAPGDPLAASYALSTALAQRLVERNAGRRVRLWPARADVLAVLFGDVDPADVALELGVERAACDPLAPDALAGKLTAKA